MFGTDIPIVRQIHKLTKNFLIIPTQKPEALLERIVSKFHLILVTSFSTVSWVAAQRKLLAMKTWSSLHRGGHQPRRSGNTTTKRLLTLAEEIQENTAQGEIDIQEQDTENTYTCYTGFEVYNVNNYDVFRNPAQAKDLLIEALEIRPLQSSEIYDGEKDGRMVKIMPINRIATRADLNELIYGFNQQTFQQRQEEHPTLPVEKLLLVCMGHEPDLKAHPRK